MAWSTPKKSLWCINDNLSLTFFKLSVDCQKPCALVRSKSRLCASPVTLQLLRWLALQLHWWRGHEAPCRGPSMCARSVVGVVQEVLLEHTVFQGQQAGESVEKCFCMCRQPQVCPVSEKKTWQIESYQYSWSFEICVSALPGQGHSGGSQHDLPPPPPPHSANLESTPMLEQTWGPWICLRAPLPVLWKPTFFFNVLPKALIAPCEGAWDGNRALLSPLQPLGARHKHGWLGAQRVYGCRMEVRRLGAGSLPGPRSSQIPKVSTASILCVTSVCVPCTVFRSSEYFCLSSMLCVVWSWRTFNRQMYLAASSTKMTN